MSFNLTQSRIAKIKNIYRVPEVIVKELPVCGMHCKNYIGQLNNAPYVRIANLVNWYFFKGTGRTRTCYSTNVTEFYNQSVSLYHWIAYNPTKGADDWWCDKGVSYAGAGPHYYYGFFHLSSEDNYYYGYWLGGSKSYVDFLKDTEDAVDAYWIRHDQYEVNWGKTLQPLYDPESPDYVNPEEYSIVYWKWGSWNSEELAILDPRMKWESDNGIIINDLSSILNISYHNKGEKETKQVFDAKHMSFRYHWSKKLDNMMLVTDLNSCLPKASKVNKPGNIECKSFDGYAVSFPATITVFLIPTEYINIWSGGGITVTHDGDEGDPPDEPGKDPGDGDSDNNNDVDTNKGSKHEGLNTTHTHYEDLVMGFDTIYISDNSYNSFVSAGGGVIGESGMFPNGEAMYIESINLNISGSTMTVIQVAKFDAAPKLKVGERIYGYLINQSGDRQPSFAGYVASMSRRLGPNGQEIVYFCKDLKHYIHQFYTPLIYKTDEYDANYIAKDILIRAGIVNFYNNLPKIKLKVNWQAESLSQVLDYLCSVSGEYYYWIDKNGYLHIDQLNGPSHIFRIPSEGESIGDNKVLSFNSMTDLTNSRSQIVVTGGGGYRIEDCADRFKGINPYNAYINKVNSFQNMEEGNGWYFIRRPFYGEFYDAYLVVSINKGQMLRERKNGLSPSVAVVRYSRCFGEDYHTKVQEGRLVYMSDKTLIFGGWTLYASLVGDVSCWKGTCVQQDSRDYWEVYYSYRNLAEPTVVTVDTGYVGGTLTFHMHEIQNVRKGSETIDETHIMEVVASKLAQFYKPIYGGKLVLDGLHIDINLGDKISLTNTDLPDNESSNLKVYGITYNVPSRTTTVSLSTLPNATGITIDPGDSKYIVIYIPVGASTDGITLNSGVSVEIKLHTAAGKEYPRMLTLP